MTQKQIAMIKELEANVKVVAGEAAADIVMKGAGDLKASTNKVKVAEWLQGAMERLDATVVKSNGRKSWRRAGAIAQESTTEP
jgi:hypothetical protein